MRHAACRTLALLCAVIWSLAAFAQAPDATAKWTVTNKKVSDNVYELTFVGRIADGWHIYPVDHKYTPVSVDYPDQEGFSAGKLVQVTEPVDFQGQKVFFDQVTLKQEVTVKGNPADIHGEVSWSGCNDEFCAAPEYWEFRVPLSPPTEGREAAKKNKGLWGLIIEAILWGFAMLLTPCVFPMVPMTISYFMKQSDNVVQGRFKAFMYGLFIILLYTVPICLIIGLTWLIGGNSITADIFNWLATHWLPNILFFVIFMVFAASFFGAFEIELPSRLANKSDAKSSSKGLSGIFFMALTLVLVSFSCTGPIVGTVLIKSTAGEFWTPMVTMLAFSIAFALPFTILALFPSILKKLKSGSWLNSVKVVLGFIEVALGFKFLSVADQTYHWGILDREVYLAIWIVVFSLLGLYLLGKIRFKNDSPVEHISVTRLALAITVFSFVVYMVPGMWGAPLKALSGYLPPIETQDFVVWSNASAPGGNAEAAAPASYADRYNLRMPMGFTGYFTLEEGLEAAKDQGKPVFVDITGHGCVNCREMEQRVWTDPRVQKIMKEDYVLVVLYNDDKTKLREEDWVTTGEGKVLKEIGRANSYLVRSRFDVNAQPNYALLGSDGGLLVPVRGYNLSVEGFIDFLESGLEQFRKQQ
ncbi:MAG: thioredoxin family protein [Bacteroidales bacterium]|nr:thioredoxin family protein [Bacteroidales bacterium]